MESNNKTVMIAAPLRDRSEILPAYLNSIYNIDYDKNNIELFWVINNSDDIVVNIINDFMDKNKELYRFMRYDVINFVDPPRVNEDRIGEYLFKCFENLAILRSRIIQKARERNIDYLLFWDSDILADENSLAKMISYDKDCIAGVVNNSDVKIAYNYMWYEPEINFFTRNKNIFETEGSLMRVSLAGAFFLISRYAYTRGDYYACKSGEDEGFCRDMMKNGINIWVDTSIRCKHIFNVDKYLKRGEVLC